MKKPKVYLLPFVKSEQVAKNTISFYFDREKSGLDFLPGQYIRMYLPHDNADEKGASRFFTISSSPHIKKFLIITTKITGKTSTFKKTLLSLMKGEEVNVFGPTGNFVLKEEENNPLVLLANGIAVTPYHSILTYLDTKSYPRPITLIVSFPSVDEMVFYEELTKIAKLHKNLKIIYTLTKEHSEWDGETGEISEKLIKKYVKNINNSTFYIVGSSIAVQKVRKILESIKVSEDRIITEDFTDY